MYDHEPAAFAHRWPIAIGVMLATILEVLDMTIVNVSLPHMMGSLGANTQQITWVLTAYIVAAAVFMPLTGFLTKNLGRRRLLLINVVGFLAASVLCGTSVSLTEILIFRTLQGIFGASLVPLSQTIMQTIFPKEEQAKAMAIWGVGVMVAPILGPTLGGYITETMNWRWIFYLNIPICLIAFILISRYLPETKREKVRIDTLGLILMAVGIGALQLFLDQGNNDNWFESNFIIALATMGGVCLFAFIVRGIKKKDNIINLRLFADRNFALATTILAFFAASMFGMLTLLPIMLEQLMNYPTATTGLVLAPQGIASATAMAVAVNLLKKVAPHKIIFTGLVFEAIGAYLISQFGPSIAMGNIMFATALMGFGMGLFFVPITMMAYHTLPKEDLAEGSGLFSFGRNLGSSIGISLLGTLLSQETQINWNRLCGHIRLDNPALQTWLSTNHLSLNNPLTAQLLAQNLGAQASMIAFLDCFFLIAITFMILLPTIFLFKRVKLDLSSGLVH